MCGLTVWISPNNSIKKSILEKMTDKIQHRGPNGSGVWINQKKTVGFGHRRLSIIDLNENANQPMQSKDCSAVIVFNGEIYNHSTLRKSLEKKGYSFLTDHSDTETLLVGYLEWGIEGLLKRLIGMFAFSIYDKKIDQVFFARDRLGIKPLYFTNYGDNFLFSSEIKSFSCHPKIKFSLNEENLFHHLTFRSLPAPLTLFNSVYKLHAGEFINYDLRTKKMCKSFFWNPLNTKAEKPKTLGDAHDILDELLSQSIKDRMVSDVPVGVFLSGGLDSGFILEKLYRMNYKVDSFTVTYPKYKQYDESASAERIALRAKSKHHMVPLDENEFISLLAKVSYYQEEPVSAPVCLPVFQLASEARKNNVPVILAGEGSDEIFIGYQNWIKLRKAQKLSDTVSFLGLGLLGKMVSSFSELFSSTFSIYPEIVSRIGSKKRLFWGGAMDFSGTAKRNLLLKKYEYSTYEKIIEPYWNEFIDKSDQNDITGWMTYIDLRFRLPELMLSRLDKMCMAHSIEGRVPFLDHRIIEFIMNLPPEWRSNSGNKTKAIFKSVSERYLPYNFVNQKKRGFQAPVKEMKSLKFGNYYKPILLEFAKNTNLFDIDYLSKLLQIKDDRLYYSMINLMIWYMLYIDNPIENLFNPKESLN